MDGKAVNSAIRSLVRPELKAAGFSHFTSRTAWRFREHSIDVVNFQSFNSYLAAVLKCTTFSFTLNLGCLFFAIPCPFGPTHLKRKGDQVLPQEYQCHFRRPLKKGMPQAEFPRHDIWFVDRSRGNLQDVVADAKTVLQREGFAWFARFSHLQEVFRTLSEDEEDHKGTWGFGRKGSPARNYMIGYVTKKLGRPELALQHLQSALASGCFRLVESHLRSEIEELGEKAGSSRVNKRIS